MVKFETSFILKMVAKNALVLVTVMVYRPGVPSTATELATAVGVVFVNVLYV